MKRVLSGFLESGWPQGLCLLGFLLGILFVFLHIGGAAVLVVKMAGLLSVVLIVLGGGLSIFQRYFSL